MHNRKPEKNNIMVCYMFCTMYYLPDIWSVKSRKMKWMGYVISMGRRGNLTQLWL